MSSVHNILTPNTVLLSQNEGGAVYQYFERSQQFRQLDIPFEEVQTALQRDWFPLEIGDVKGFINPAYIDRAIICSPDMFDEYALNNIVEWTSSRTIDQPVFLVVALKTGGQFYLPAMPTPEQHHIILGRNIPLSLGRVVN